MSRLRVLCGLRVGFIRGGARRGGGVRGSREPPEPDGEPRGEGGADQRHEKAGRRRFGGVEGRPQGFQTEEQGREEGDVPAPFREAGGGGGERTPGEDAVQPHRGDSGGAQAEEAGGLDEHRKDEDQEALRKGEAGFDGPPHVRNGERRHKRSRRAPFEETARDGGETARPATPDSSFSATPNSSSSNSRNEMILEPKKDEISFRITEGFRERLSNTNSLLVTLSMH